MDWLGSPHWAMDWLGSLSGHALGETISLKGWIGAGPYLFEAGLLLFGTGQSHMDVLSLDPGYLFVHSLCGLSLVLYVWPRASAYPIFLPNLAPSSMH